MWFLMLFVYQLNFYNYDYYINVRMLEHCSEMGSVESTPPLFSSGKTYINNLMKLAGKIPNEWRCVNSKLPHFHR